MGDEAPAAGARPLRIVVVDDDAFARRAVVDVLRDAGMEVIGEAADGTTGVELVRSHRPDLVVMDIVMPGVDGLAATRRILRDRPGQLVVLLTNSGNDDLGMLGLREGAAGYLGKELDLEVLPRVIEGAVRGEAAITRTMAMRLLEQLRRIPPPGRGLRPVHSPLTTREWEVLDLLCDGASTESIADALVVSSETVRSHVKSILHKLGVKSRKEATEVARRMRSVDA
jgi:two-component system, NarL family, response regulator LiaR